MVPNQWVEEIEPNGVSQFAQTGTAAPNLGTLMFSAPIAGTYKIVLAGPSVAPNAQMVTLSPSDQYAAVTLPLMSPGALLSVTAADGKGFTFDETLSYRVFNVTYSNPLTNTGELFLLSTPLPSNFTQTFSANTLSNGATTQMMIGIPQWCLTATASVTIEGVVNGALVASRTLTFTRAWSLELDFNYGVNPACQNNGNSFTLGTTLHCKGCSGGPYPLTLTLDNDLAEYFGYWFNSNGNYFDRVFTWTQETDGTSMTPVLVKAGNGGSCETQNDTMSFQWASGSTLSPAITEPENATGYSGAAVW
jgi:hypothetical protein